MPARVAIDCKETRDSRSTSAI